MAVNTVTQTISSASALRKGAGERKLFAANKASRDSALPAAIAVKGTAEAGTVSATGATTLQKKYQVDRAWCRRVMRL